MLAKRKRRSLTKRTLISLWRRSLIRRLSDEVTTLNKKKWPNLKLMRQNKNRQKTSHLMKRRLKNRKKSSLSKLMNLLQSRRKLR